MKFKRHFLIVAVLSVFLLTGCIDDSEITITKNLDFFKNVYFNDAFNVTLVQDSTNMVIIRGAADFANDVSCRVVNNTLTIDSNKKYKWLWPEDNKLTLEVHSPEFYIVWAYETCKIITLDTIRGERVAVALTSKLSDVDFIVECDYLSFFNSSDCGGRASFVGKAETFRCRCKGLIEIDAASLKIKNLLVEQSSKVDCELYSDSCINYSIYNVGNIIAYGNPEVVEAVEINSTGRLILME